MKRVLASALALLLLVGCGNATEPTPDESYAVPITGNELQIVRDRFPQSNPDSLQPTIERIVRNGYTLTGATTAPELAPILADMTNILKDEVLTWNTDTEKMNDAEFSRQAAEFVELLTPTYFFGGFRGLDGDMWQVETGDDIDVTVGTDVGVGVGEMFGEPHAMVSVNIVLKASINGTEVTSSRDITYYLVPQQQDWKVGWVHGEDNFKYGEKDTGL